MNDWEQDNLDYHRKCLVEIAQHLGLLQEITDSEDTRVVLRSSPNLNLKLYDDQGVTEISAGDIAWDVLGAIDEQKSLIQHAVKILADHGVTDSILSNYVELMRDFPIRANPDRRDI